MRRPKTKPPKPVQAVILFADLMNSSLFADALGTMEYDVLIEEFQKTMQEAKEAAFLIGGPDQTGFEFSIRGDEAVTILYSADTRHDIAWALQLAFYMKTMWLRSRFNLTRLRAGKMPSEVGIGVHTGRVIVRSRLSTNSPAKAEGYAINLAKRIEGLSRKGKNWRIMLSHPVKILMDRFGIKVTVGDPIVEDLKGIFSPTTAFEISNFPEVFYRSMSVMNPDDIPLFIEYFDLNPQEWLAESIIMSLYLRGGYGKALEFITTRGLNSLRHYGIRLLHFGMLEALGKYEEALTAHSQLEETFPEMGVHGYQVEKASLLGYMGQADEAIGMALNAIRSGLQTPYAYATLGRLYLMKFRSAPKSPYPKKRILLKKAREAFEHNTRPMGRLIFDEDLFFLGLIQELEDDPQGAQVHFDQCIETLRERLIPDGLGGREEVMQTVRAGYCCQKLGRHEEGRKYLSQAIKAARRLSSSTHIYSYIDFRPIKRSRFIKQLKSIGDD